MPSYINTSIGRKYFITGQTPFSGADSIARFIATDPLRDYRNAMFQIPVRLIPNPPAPVNPPTTAASLQPRYYDFSLKNGKRISFRKQITFNPDLSAEQRWSMRIALVSRDDDDAPLTGNTVFSGSSWADVTTYANKYAVAAIFTYLNNRSNSLPNTCGSVILNALVNESGEYFKQIFDGMLNGFSVGEGTYSNNITLALYGS